MQHPLRQARPSDPFLRLRLADAHVDTFAIDGDHVAFLRSGRTSGETWVTALGDDPSRVLSLIEQLREHHVDGVTVHDDVFAHLPDSLRGPDPGHWSLWELTGEPGPVGATVTLDSRDPRINALLTHSSSAYIHAGDPSVDEWRGIVEGEELVAVGARISAGGGRAHLVSICTAPDRRGRGLGKATTAALAAEALAQGARGVWLEMYAANAPAARAYRAIGFEEKGRYRSALLPART